VTLTTTQLAEQVKRVAEKCADRAHRAAGTHYASPRLGQPRKRAPKALRPFEAQPGQGDVYRKARRGQRTYRREQRHARRAGLGTSPTRTVVRLAKHNPYVAAGITGLRVALICLLLILIAVPTVYWGWVEPKLRTLQSLAPDFDDEFGQDDLPEWHQRIIPGSLNACVQPTSTLPPLHDTAHERIAAGWGRTLNRVVNADVTGAGVSAAMRGTFVAAGATFETFRQAVQGVDTTATPESQVQPSAVTPAGLPVTGPLTDIQVAELARAVGWPEAEVPRVVARVAAESGGDPQARDYADGTHHGLLQLGTDERAQYLEPGASAFDPRANLRAARKLWEARGWQPWAASDTGHVKYLSRGRAAVHDAGTAPPAGTIDCGSIRLASVPGGPPQGGAENDLSANALYARRAVLAEFPGTTVGGWGERGGRKTEHDDRDPVTGRKASRAIDVMTYEDMAKGERVSQWVLANAQALRVEYMIWNRRIWSPGRGWRPYAGPSPHTDHPHLTLLPDDASGQTA
jgi:hypothetical protein